MGKVLLTVCLLLSVVGQSHAEFVQMERLLAPYTEELVGQIGDRSVVVAGRQIGSPIFWQPHEACCIELTAALRNAKVDAIRYANHPRSLALGLKSAPFNATDAKTVKQLDRDLLVTTSIALRPKPQLEIALFQAKDGRKTWRKVVELPKAAMNIEANVPTMNEHVRRFCLENIDRAVGGGECAELATHALKHAKATRLGVYTWGRELGDREAVLPGDIVQLELAKMVAPNFSRNFAHHTAVVESVREDALVVLHQNVGSKGRVVQRDVWPLNANQTGYIVFYRPSTGETPLAPVSPRRRVSATVRKRGTSIDLLKTLDPRLDAVKGIWFRDGGLKSNRDTAAKLQIPLSPPEAYSLKMRVTRLFGTDALGIGLVVGEHQALLTIDGYKGKISGFHTLDGKKSHSNESTFRGELLPLGQELPVTVDVQENSVRLTVDGQTIVDWQGDPSRLAVIEDYHVPRSDWLFLATWNTQFEILEYQLESSR